VRAKIKTNAHSRALIHLRARDFGVAHESARQIMRSDLHRPPHLFIDDTIYFVTGRTFRQEAYFDTKEKLLILSNVFKKSVKKYNFNVFAWVLLKNHYHLLFKIDNALNISKFVKNFHTNSARLLNELNGRALSCANPRDFNGRALSCANPRDFNGRALSCANPRDFNGRALSCATPFTEQNGLAHDSVRENQNRIWYQYWDYCIRDEKDFWKHFNYIHNNPLKHGLVGNLESALKYEFSSGNLWLEEKGSEWLNSIFEAHPIIDFTPQFD